MQGASRLEDIWGRDGCSTGELSDVTRDSSKVGWRYEQQQEGSAKSETRDHRQVRYSSRIGNICPLFFFLGGGGTTDSLTV